jgi:hypothetical protein
MLNIRSNGIYHYSKVLINHFPFYHGYIKKGQPNSSIPRDSQDSVEVYICTHTEKQDKPPHLVHQR